MDHTTPILIVGAGPAGLISAVQLARYGIKTMLVDQSLESTRWPKMDITNCRSMELFRKLGISEGLREIGVGQDYSFDVLFSTGLSDGERVCVWDLPSPNQWRENIKQQNDGSMPREPYQRCSQVIFEAWLRRRIQTEPLITSHFGLKFESLVEEEDGVTSKLINGATGEEFIVKSQYVIGCDGAGSRVRRSIGAELSHDPIQGDLLLIHFKSRDLKALQAQGQFWHLFFTSGAVLIAQDEIDTWTIHIRLQPGVDCKNWDLKDAIYQALGGSLSPYPIEVDEILVSSKWKGVLCIADRYTSLGGRVFLTGDAAHQNIPTGGYGMNTAIGDSFDIGWKLAAVLNGFGGKELLASYETERKPTAVRNLQRSLDHYTVRKVKYQWIADAGDTITARSKEGDELRSRIKEHLLANDGENKDHGIEMDYRLNGSPIVVPDTDANAKEPEWNYRNYTPSTWPGARAPHVFLVDGETSIFDLFGPGFTLIDFADGKWATRFHEAAEELKIPLKAVHIPDEKHAREIWGRNAVLIRPDDHVAWRFSGNSDEQVDVGRILRTVTGHEVAVWPKSLRNGEKCNGTVETA